MVLELLYIATFAPLALLVGTYVIYPFGAMAIAVLKRSSSVESGEEREDGSWPFLSVIICAFNEEDSIADKLANTLELEYPRDRLEVLVASDGSTDATDEIVDSYPDERVRLVRNDERGGKTRTAQLAVYESRGEILVFSDATGMYSPNALKSLADVFRNPDVGAASGRVLYRYADTPTSRGFRLYQKWIVAQRSAECALHTATSVSGSIHAIRRSLFQDIPGHITYDLAVPAIIAMSGQRSAYVAAAESWEASRVKVKDEFAARVRLAIGAYGFCTWLWSKRGEISDLIYFAQLFCHKVLRWFSPHLLLCCLFGHTGLAGLFGGLWATLWGVHMALYLVAGILFSGARMGLRVPGSGLFLLFVAANAAHLVGFYRALAGDAVVAWTPDREGEAQSADQDSPQD